MGNSEANLPIAWAVGNFAPSSPPRGEISGNADFAASELLT
jgi:hypothetical protein